MGHSDSTASSCPPALQLHHGGLQACIGSKRKRLNDNEMPKMQKWSKEALRAMETHLLLLNRGAASQAKRSLMEGESGPLVELNSQAPLPRGWEQFLDLRTGQVYYIDWNSFKRSYTDPRKVKQRANENVFLLLKQARADGSMLTEPSDSECITDGSNNLARISGNSEVEVESKWAFPMLKEDWDLVKARGWVLPTSDDHSEVGSPNSVQSSSSFCDVQSNEK